MWINTLFPTILNMTFTSSIAICFVLIARLLLKPTPKIFSYTLWAVVLFRLLYPVSFTSCFSLLNIANVPVAQTGSIEFIPSDIAHAKGPSGDIFIPGVSEIINSHLLQRGDQMAVGTLETPVLFVTILWLGGVITMIVYSINQIIKLRKKLICAVPLQANIHLSDYIVSPFVMGLLRPKIYLPSTLSETEQAYIIQHEQHHIHRGDHIIRILAFVALCIHWFNPLVWLAFFLSGKDMEMSCDEAVMKRMGGDIRADYSFSLLRFSSSRRSVSSTPLMFGEGETKSRIKNVMKYKRPPFWVISVSSLACVALVGGLLANPAGGPGMRWAKTLQATDIEKIELVCLHNSEDQQYHLYGADEYSELIKLINSSRGQRLFHKPKAPFITGPMTYLYITTSDGVRHSFVNCKNNFLVIDGEIYDPTLNWLSSWYSLPGTDPVPDSFWSQPGVLAPNSIYPMADVEDAAPNQQ